jgi:hypothetical protein
MVDGIENLIMKNQKKRQYFDKTLSFKNYLIIEA